MTKTNLSQSIAIAANIGVIIGIAFLGVEIRGSTVATQAASLHTASELDQSFLIEIGSDAELSRIWTAYVGEPEALTDDEKTQATFLFAALMRRLENILLQYELGALSEDGWQSRRGLFAGIANTPGFAVFRQSQSARLSSQAILDYMDQLVVSPP